ncbi:MAG: ABC transporter substrate-binding protein [Chloroflexota bacterium]
MRLAPRRFAPLLLAIGLAGCGGSAAPAASSPSAPTAPSSAVAKPSAATSVAPVSAASAAAQATPAVSPGATVEMRIGGIPSSAAAPILVPMADGSFAARGIKTTFTPVTDTAQAMVSIASGQLDIGTVTMGPAALNALNRGTDLVELASGGVDPPGHGAFAPVVVRSDLMDSGAVKTMADLKSRKVALNGKGVILEYDLYKALALGNLKPADVDVITMPWPDMVVALGTKALDAGLIGQPLATQAVSKGFGKILSDDYAQGNQNAVVITNKKYLAAHPDTIQAFLEVYVQYIRKLADGAMKKDDAALATLEKYTKVTPDVMRQAPDQYWPKDARINAQSLGDQQAYFLSVKSVDYTQPLDFSKIIDQTLLEKALKNIGG